MCRHDLAYALLIFPLVVIVLTIAGFLFGIPVSKLHLPFALLLTLVLMWFLSCREDRKLLFITFGCVWAVSIFVASLPVMYTITDGANCHRPAAFLLVNGWNPFRQTELHQLAGLLNKHFNTTLFHLRYEHIAFTPKAAWIYGAVLYKFFGFVEIADGLVVYVVITSVIFVISWLARYTLLSFKMRTLLSALLCLGPHVAGSIFGGGIDASMYLLTIVGLLSFDAFRRESRRIDLVFGVLALAFASSIKFTGIAMAILIPISYLLFCSGRKYYAASLLAIVACAVLLNASPIVTSWINHGGPFYPAHSFDKKEKIADNMTFDFDIKNKDAQQMGYCGRFCYAFVSKELTKEYYKNKLHQDTFNPQLLLFYEIDGFGSVYRLFLWLSLFALFFVKDRGVRLMSFALFVSIFLLPGKYMGYSRYVAQVYAVPILVFTGLIMQTDKKWKRRALIASLCIYTAAQLKGPLMSYPYMWLQSVQNLQSVLALERDSKPQVASEYYYAAFALKNDTNSDVQMLSLDQATTNTFKHSYGPLNQRFMYLTNEEIPDFRDFSCAQIADSNAIMNKTFSAQRRQGIEKYFIKEFLPKELPLLPKRFCQTMAYRGRQLVRTWSK